MKLANAQTLSVHVPFKIHKHGGRKVIDVPHCERVASRKTDNTLIRALARAFRWKQMLESGKFATMAELAERESIASSDMTRVIRLNLLAPKLVEAIVEGGQGPEL